MFVKQELRFSLLCDAYNCNIDTYSKALQMYMFATFRIKVSKQIILLEFKSRIGNLKEKNDGGSVRIKGMKTLYLTVFHSKHT